MSPNRELPDTEPEMNEDEVDEATGLPRYLLFSPSAESISARDAIRTELDKAIRKTKTSAALHAKQTQEDVNLPIFAALMEYVGLVATDLTAQNYRLAEWTIDQLEQVGDAIRAETILSQLEDPLLGVREQFLLLSNEVKATIEKIVASPSDTPLATLLEGLRIQSATLQARHDAIVRMLDGALASIALVTSDEDEDEDEGDDENEDESNDENENEPSDDEILA